MAGTEVTTCFERNIMKKRGQIHCYLKAFCPVRFCLYLILLLILAGCASRKPVYSGFLEEYPDFQPGQKGGVDLVYLKEGIDFKKYNKVMLDHIVFYPHPEAQFKGLEADDLKEMETFFHSALKKEMEKDYPLVSYPVVDEAGPDVMRIRIAVTDIHPGRPAVCGARVAVYPVSVAAGGIRRAVTGENFGVGSASMEVEMSDSITNQRIAAAIDKYTESSEFCTGRYGAVNEAFQFWATRLRVFMDNIHGN